MKIHVINRMAQQTLAISFITLFALSVSACDKKEAPQVDDENKVVIEQTSETSTQSVIDEQDSDSSHMSTDVASDVSSSNLEVESEAEIEVTESEQMHTDEASNVEVSSIDEDALDATDTTSMDAEVDYVCKDDKSLTVFYQFDADGKPINAEIDIDGTLHSLPINATHTNELDTRFGDESTYALATDTLTQDNVEQKSIIVTSPEQEILFKNCEAVQQ